MIGWLTRARWNAFVLWHTRGEAELPYRPLEDIRAVQSRRVRRIVTHAYRTVPNLLNRATVLLNYRLGDIVTLAALPCPCGRRLPTIQHIIGRSDDLIALPGDEVAHGLVVLEHVRAVPGVQHVQIVQHALRQFLLRVVCANDIDWTATRDGLRAAMQKALGTDIVLDIERRDEIPPEPGGKVRAVVSHCRTSAAAGEREPGRSP